MKEFAEFMSGLGILIQAHPWGFVIALFLWGIVSFISGFMTSLTREWFEYRKKRQ